MLIDPSEQFQSDLQKLRKENAKFAAKAIELVFGAIDAIESYNNPLHGLGKPEALKDNLSGFYSREITEKHRLVYGYNEDKSIIRLVTCWGHYQ